ncbi:uncharacterized protein TNCV_1946581 [Trichonephila clavipes]|uniref:Uncharacterized protein n=1 Tax=Trichonephila clavipes TaxID=2585209 RepID=A0A8X6SNG3_TRICX|nr:uncharacterized protein TNCV_1946581 [Trichonephila clavipes]
MEFEEQAEILKEIENAERLNRRQMARNISEPVGKVPCNIPDKLHYAEKQAAMEDAIENIFKKPRSTKEHAVEDLDGYEDKWEVKYKEIDSVMESKMAECVPSFVKENYSYLLQEETIHPRGKHFSGLDDSIEDLNTAYIESPPADIVNNSKEIDAVISQLDQMRSELNEAYEKEFKPLLEAESAPKAASIDKAVETDLLKVPTEDKAVEIGSSLPEKPVASSSRSVQVDIMQGGLMSFKRRGLGSMYRSHTNELSSYLPQPKMVPAEWIGDEPTSFSSGLESWSSSSYRSLPSKHGMPNICRFCDSPSCTIPLVEDKKLHKDCIPLAKSSRKPFSDLEEKSASMVKSSEKSIETKSMICDKLPSNSVKSKLSSYVQIVADKYLKNKPKVPTESVDRQIYENSLQVGEHSSLDSDFKSESSVAFSKTKFGASEHINISPKRKDNFLELSEEDSEKSFHTVHTKPNFPEDFVTYDKPDRKLESSKLVHDMKSPDKKSILIGTDSSIEDELLQKCREIISANLSEMFSSSNRNENVYEDVSGSLKQIVDSDQSGTSEIQLKNDTLTGYIYHDLSTIPEMDSALTNDTMHSGTKESPDEAGRSPKRTSLLNEISEDVSPDEVDTTSVSLVDAPVSEVSKLAKSIRFVEASLEPALLAMDLPGEYQPLISGTLSTFHYSPSAAAKVQSLEFVDMLKTPSIQSVSDDQVYSTPQDIQSSDNGFESCNLQTPSSLSTIQSQLSAKSQDMPFSSSFKDLNFKHHHLTHVSPLSKYFRDISSIKQDSGASSSEISSVKSEKYSIANSEKWIIKQPVLFPIHSKRQFEMQENSSNSFKPMTPQSYLSSPVGTYQEQAVSNDENCNLKKKIHLSSQAQNISDVFHSPEGSSDSFKPMTPCLHLTSPSKFDSKQATSTKSVPSSKSNQQAVSHYASQIGAASLEKTDSSSGSFRPLSSQSDVSTPKNPSPKNKNIGFNEKTARYPYAADRNIQYENTGTTIVNSFQPLSMLSNVSTPKIPSPKSKNINFNDKKAQCTYDTDSIQHKNSGANFQPLSLQPDASTPKNPSLNNTDFNEKLTQGVHDKSRAQQSKNSESNSFQPLSMQSDVSTPKYRAPENKNIDLYEKNVHDTKYQKHNYENITSTFFQPMTPQSHLSSPSNTLNSNRLNDSSVRKEISSNEKQKSFKSEFINNQNKENGLISNVPRNIIYPLQLDFGIKSTAHYLNPMKDLENDIGDDSNMQELSNVDLLRSDPSVRHKYLLASKKKDAKTVRVPSSGFVPNLTPADFTSFKGDRTDNIKKDISAITEKVAEGNTAASSVPSTMSDLLINYSQNANDAKITLLDMNSVGQVDVSPSGNFVGLPSVKSSNSILDALKQRFASIKSSTPLSTPSNGSSSENLSEMFADSKITYQSTPVKSIEQIIQETGILDEPDLTLVNTEYTVKPDSPEKSKLLESCSLLTEDVRTPTSSQITDLTPSKLVMSTETPDSPSCDSPSMISFLKHEHSCLTNAEENQWSVKKVSKLGYKKRTKRLWNNLEEVRKKKSMEEKREQLMKNRMKMKAYSKEADVIESIKIGHLSSKGFSLSFGEFFHYPPPMDPSCPRQTTDSRKEITGHGPPAKSGFRSQAQIHTWSQSGFGPPRILAPPQCGGVRYATPSDYCWMLIPETKVEEQKRIRKASKSRNDFTKAKKKKVHKRFSRQHFSPITFDQPPKTYLA